MNQFEMTVNRLPVPTWNHLRMNEVKIRVSEGAGAGTLTIEKPEEVRLETAREGISRYASVPTGMGSDVDELLAGAQTQVHILSASRKVKEPVRLNFAFGGEGQARHFVGISAGEGAELTVIMDFGDNGDAPAKKEDQREVAVVQTKIQADRSSLVRLVQIHRGPKDWTVMNDTGSLCREMGRVEVIQLVLSGGANLIGSRTELEGNGSSLRTDVAYRVEGDDRLDMNVVVNHRGRHTVSDIDCLGVLRDRAFKLFRGTIDFKKGAKASQGSEKEDVLLMDDGVTNQTIPLILCAEEDVEGNHGATIGQLDQDAMFYLLSRGLSQTEALALVEKGRLTSVIRRIPDEKTKEKLLAAVGE